MSIKQRAGLAATVGITLVASTAIAAPTPANRAPSTSVTYSTANLATDRGVRALYERIIEAAKAVCPTYEEHAAGLGRFLASKSCQRKAVARALRQIDNPRLTAIAAVSKGKT